MPAKQSRTPARKPRVVLPEPAPSYGYGWWLWSGQPTFEGVCHALAQQYAILDGLLQPLLAGRAAAGPDRWRVAVSLAQLSAVADQVLSATQEPPGPASGWTAVDWYRKRHPGHARVAAEAVARSEAGRVLRAGVADLALRHRGATATAMAVLRSGEPGRILGGPADGLQLAEFAVTRLVEAVVHGLDLADALGRPGVADPTSVNLVSGFLAVVADQAGTDQAGTATHTAPISVDGEGSLVALSADRRRTRIPAVDWIRAATGRRPAAELLPASHDWLAADLPLVA